VRDSPAVEQNQAKARFSRRFQPVKLW